MRRLAALAFITALTWPASALAKFEDRTPVKLDDSAAQTTASSSGGALIRTFIGLIVVLAVIYGCYRALQLLHRRSAEGDASPAVQLISRTALDRENSVYIIRTGEQITVTICGPHRSQLLRTLTAEEAEDEGLLASVPPAVTENFRDVWNKALVKVSRARDLRHPNTSDAGRQETTVSALLDDKDSR